MTNKLDNNENMEKKDGINETEQQQSSSNETVEQEVNKEENNEVVEKEKAEDLSFENKSIENKEELIKKEFRTFSIKKPSIDKAERKVSLSIASEEPYQRTFGTEILSHEKGEQDFKFLNSGRAPLLLNHDFEKQIGVIESAKVSEADKTSRAIVRFGKSQLADEVFQDIVDGIRSNVSVGYEITKMVKAKGKQDEDNPKYRVNWKPLEASIVSVPADTTVGVGRSVDFLSTDNNSLKERIEVISHEEKHMEKANETPKVETPKVNVEEIQAKARKDETARIKEITQLGSKHNCSDLASKAINDNVSVSNFRGVVLDKLGEAKPLESKEIGLSKNESKDYSIAKAVKAMVTGDWTGAELEREASDAVARKTGKTPRGIFVPTDVSWQRDLTQGSATAGGNLVATNLMSGSFIEALRARMVVREAGATFMSGLVGDVAIPAQNAVTSASWVAENSAVSEVNPTYRQVTMAPKTLGTFVDLSRHLMHQSTPAIETIIRGDIIKSLSNEVDKKAIQGDGTSNTPTGILSTSGIGAVAIGTNGGAGTWAKVVETWKEVATDNADVGSLGWITSPLQISRFMSTAKVSSSDSVMIMNDQANLMGYKVFSTTNAPDNLTKGTSSGDCSALIFGNYNDLIIGEWGNLDIAVDPYTGSSAGTTRIVGLYDVDVAVRHAESFAAIKDINA